MTDTEGMRIETLEEKWPEPPNKAVIVGIPLDEQSEGNIGIRAEGSDPQKEEDDPYGKGKRKTVWAMRQQTPKEKTDEYTKESNESVYQSIGTNEKMTENADQSNIKTVYDNSDTEILTKADGNEVNDIQHKAEEDPDSMYFPMPHDSQDRIPTESPDK